MSLSSAEQTNPSTGNEGCPCIDASQTLASLDSRSCTTSDGEIGVLLTPESASCIPTYYGSNACLQHDMLYNEVCEELDDTKTFCLHNWCYVDMESCKTNSFERVYRSIYFDESPEMFFPSDVPIDLFYSYTTCNSTALDGEMDKPTHSVLGGVNIISLSSDIPPMAYKRDDAGEIIRYSNSGLWMNEYKNDSIPFEGFYIDYVKELMKLSNGDIATVNYTHPSNNAKSMHPESSGTAVIQDIADGLVDMAVGPFWITGERLRLAAFTLPIVYDKTVLVIPNPKSTPSALTASASKVFHPFKPGLIAVSCLIILIAALLSLWLVNREKLAAAYGRSLRDLNTGKRNIGFYGRLALDSVLQKSMFFFGAAVEQNELQDTGAPLSLNILMCGYSFFILIAVSAYVANLAAFLTSETISTVSTMQGAVDAGMKICAHPALKEELVIKWPLAKFEFSSGGNFNGILDDYEAKTCQVMAIGREDTEFDETLLERFCRLELVYTDSLVLETPIAFAINPKFASGFSYWIQHGQKFEQVSIEQSKKKYQPSLSCNVELKDQGQDTEDHPQITVLNMIFPITVFVFCAIIAVIVHSSKRLHPKQFRGRSLYNAGHSSGVALQQVKMNAGKSDNDSGEDDWKENEAIDTEKNGHSGSTLFIADRCEIDNIARRVQQIVVEELENCDKSTEKRRTVG